MFHMKTQLERNLQSYAQDKIAEKDYVKAAAALTILKELEEQREQEQRQENTLTEYEP